MLALYLHSSLILNTLAKKGLFKTPSSCIQNRFPITSLSCYDGVNLIDETHSKLGSQDYFSVEVPRLGRHRRSASLPQRFTSVCIFSSSVNILLTLIFSLFPISLIYVWQGVCLFRGATSALFILLKRRNSSLNIDK